MTCCATSHCGNPACRVCQLALIKPKEPTKRKPLDPKK